MYHRDSVGITRGTLRTFLRLRTDKEFPHFDAKNKLELLAVKAGMKPAFLGVVRGSETPLRVASALLDLRCKPSTTPPPYFSRTSSDEQFSDRVCPRSSSDSILDLL
jgi:hypothetical protein